jgi:CDP-paratose 2-epimerase
MKLFVTGGLGVIGSEFSKQMLERGYEVTVLDACEEPRNEWAAAQLSAMGAKIRRERMEVADLAEALDCDLILHAAAFTGIPCSSELPDDDWVSNVDTTRRLLKTLMNARTKPFTVVLSSVKPYSLKGFMPVQQPTRWTWPDDVGVNESCPLDPDEPYAASKMAQSAICIAYTRTYDLPLTVFRCSNLYGPAPCHGPRHGWLTWLCISAALGVPITVQGNGLQSRDMLYSSDVTSATMAAYSHVNAVVGKLFNVGGGSENVISIIEAAKTLCNMSGVELKFGPSRRFEDLAFVTDASAFRSATGWCPEVSVEVGLRRVYKWACEHRTELANLYRGVL